MPVVLVGWGRRPFVPMRMNKTGNFTLQSSLTKVTGWTDDAAYPGTVQVGNALRLPQGVYVIRAIASFSKSIAPATFTARVYVGGVAIGVQMTDSSNTPGSVTFAPVSVTVGAGGADAELRASYQFGPDSSVVTPTSTMISALES